MAKRIPSDPVKRLRSDWNYKTTLDAYQPAGFTGHKWNGPAARALAEFAITRSGILEPNEPAETIIATNAAAAVQAGCQDPMVNYLFIKFSMAQTNSKEAFSDAFRKMADTMQRSSYPPIRKFYASLRTSQQLEYAADPDNPPQVTFEYRLQAMTNLVQALTNQWTPIQEVDEACHQMLESLGRYKDAYDGCYQMIEPLLSKNWPDQPVVSLLKGEVCITKAWLARGGGYADKVTPEGWKLFYEHLGEAETILSKAWELDSTDERLPIQMLKIAEGLQHNRKTMELWFNRAMAINPNSYDACHYKLHYLYPQWYGSRADMVAFGRECVANTNWGGRVPLILVDAHGEYARFMDDTNAAATYWQLPDVWPDIKSAYDRFFELNPAAIGYYHNYAWFAYHAKQWHTLNELIPKLGPVNYEFFGGKDEFNKMVQLAEDHADTPK